MIIIMYIYISIFYFNIYMYIDVHFYNLSTLVFNISFLPDAGVNSEFHDNLGLGWAYDEQLKHSLRWLRKQSSPKQMLGGLNGLKIFWCYGIAPEYLQYFVMWTGDCRIVAFKCCVVSAFFDHNETWIIVGSCKKSNKLLACLIFFIRSMMVQPVLNLTSAAAVLVACSQHLTWWMGVQVVFLI